MFGFVRTAIAIGAAVVLLVAGPGAAAAEPAGRANGTVLVFGADLTSADRYIDPIGCVKLPAFAHLLINQTDRRIRVFVDPLCLGPNVSVGPGDGAYLTPLAASFSA